MLAAATDAGLVYICNPNNPTASITPKDQVRTFLARVPRKTMVLIDEAYHHYVESNDYESVIPLVRQYPNLIVARTFSKIYGMAGLRCGYCIARPELIQRMRSQQMWDSVNIMALVAAAASLEDSEQVEQGRKRNSDVKKFVYSELDRFGFKWIPSQANFLMIDLRREVKPVIAAMREQCAGRASFPCIAHLHARHDRHQATNGNFCFNFSRSDDLSSLSFLNVLCVCAEGLFRKCSPPGTPGMKIDV